MFTPPTERWQRFIVARAERIAELRNGPNAPAYTTRSRLLLDKAAMSIYRDACDANIGTAVASILQGAGRNG